MKSNRTFRLVIYLLMLFVLLIATYLRSRKRPLKEMVRTNQQTRITENGDHRFQRNVELIQYTRHARCRMACRHITVSEVEDIMVNGSINENKSDLRANPCPEYALEGYTREDEQHVRIIFAQCPQQTKVVTCIDLDKEYHCSCN